jgi:hypothetical protein
MLLGIFLKADFLKRRFSKAENIENYVAVRDAVESHPVHFALRPFLRSLRLD